MMIPLVGLCQEMGARGSRPRLRPFVDEDHLRPLDGTVAVKLSV